MTAKLLIALVRAYQLTLSPLLGGSCRFLPTCSAYAIEALQTHGALRGTALALRRLSACHPMGRSGFDPVPAPRSSRLRSQAASAGHARIAPRS
jgi:putative membrane protein insertion efficiency factor